MATELDLTIDKGKDFLHVVRWESAPIIYKAITAITKAAPVVITSTAHGVPNGWRAAIVSVKGMTQLNAKNTPLKASDYNKIDVLTSSTVSINNVNSADFTTYTSGGYLQYNTPVDLSGFTARMSVKDKVGGTEILRLDTANTRIAIDTVNYTITLSVTAAITAAITASLGVYDLELVSATGAVTALHTGVVTFNNEVTTT
jgi:hypothetical protein